MEDSGQRIDLERVDALQSSYPFDFLKPDFDRYNTDELYESYNDLPDWWRRSGYNSPANSKANSDYY